MSDYGLKVFNASGGVVLDTSDYITRNRYKGTIVKDTTGSFNISGITGKKCASIILPIGDPYLKCLPRHSLSGDVVSYNYGTMHPNYTITSLYYLFLMD
jgi:hypothetical protein